MNSYFSQIASAVVIATFGLVNILLLWSLHRQWWALPTVRRASWMVPVIGLAADGLWALCVTIGFRFGVHAFAPVVAFFFVTSVALSLTLPFSGAALTLERLARWIARRIKARSSQNVGINSPVPALDVPVGLVAADVDSATQNRPFTMEKNATEKIERVDRSRRSLLTTGAAIIPAFAIGTSSHGMLSSGNSVEFPNVELFFDDLPPGLDGLRVLHMSDIHLGYYITLDSLEQMLAAARLQRPDLVLVTGDVSDDLTVLPDALRMIADLRPRYGTYASLGNHEYYRGIGEVLRAFDAGPVPLLVERGETIRIGNADLHIAAADDPAAGGKEMGGGKTAFLRSSVEKAFDGAPSQAFSLLMSHRPEGFDPAADMGIQMTIAGHTHAGGQMGWNGRSLVETWLGVGKYMWGYYEKNGGSSKLYTSAGAGHWFPFRLGVPREVPVYILRRGRGSDRLV